MILNDGISKNFDGKYDFDYTQDLDLDIINLSKDSSGVRQTPELTYFYAYKFNENANKQDIKEFRTLFKHNFNDSEYFYKDSVMDFIELGMLRMDNYMKLEDFDIVFMTDFGHGDTAGVMSVLDSLLLEYTNGAFLDFRLVKATYEKVKFDKEKAKNALMSTEKYKDEFDEEDAVNQIDKEFNRMKKQGSIFKMKRFMPVIGRCGFYDFLEFETPRHEQIFRKMVNGTKALICDDFITSGSTVKEAKRYLHSINPNVDMTVFVLIDQLREY